MLVDIFKTGIWKAKLNLNLYSLEKEIESIVKKDRGRKISNVGGYQTNDIDYEKHTQLLFLSEIIKVNTRSYRDSVGLNQNFKIDNMWININKYKDFNKSHLHPYSSISGVFYVKCPKDCGDIVLENNSKDFLSYDWNPNIKTFTSYTSSDWVIPCEKNLLLLFPSYLRHYVQPKLVEEERISLSFNIK